MSSYIHILERMLSIGPSSEGPVLPGDTGIKTPQPPLPPMTLHTLPYTPQPPIFFTFGQRGKQRLWARLPKPSMVPVCKWILLLSQSPRLQSGNSCSPSSAFSTWILRARTTCDLLQALQTLIQVQKNGWDELSLELPGASDGVWTRSLRDGSAGKGDCCEA